MKFLVCRSTLIILPKKAGKDSEQLHLQHIWQLLLSALTNVSPKDIMCVSLHTEMHKWATKISFKMLTELIEKNIDLQACQHLTRPNSKQAQATHFTRSNTGK